jgi:hypothetical protein
VESFGLSFDCTLSFAEIVARLNELGPWQWHERSSTSHAKLATARPSIAQLELIETRTMPPLSYPPQRRLSPPGFNGQRFAILVRANMQGTAESFEWIALAMSIREELLPGLGATRIQPTSEIP